jgi:hypothetical protein
MKKFVLGCLGVLVLATIGGVIAGYVFVYRPVKSYVTSFAELAEIPNIERQIANTASFTPPADSKLDVQLVERYMRVQHALEQRMGSRVNELDAKYAALNKANGGHPSVADGLGALKDLGSLIVEAKRAQVAALNDQHFSLAEYVWTRRTVYAATGLPLELDLEQIVKQADRGQKPDASTLNHGPVHEVPDQNKQLVAPYAEALRRRIALAFFGL